ncbi:MAG: hypothetical protein NZ805_06725 [Armatimonadetes bacterium]|nr:hypothetical protein [Armatimonadota bacterium]MDW8026779.1 hypothetical protein [Armatimonadota bacterium]
MKKKMGHLPWAINWLILSCKVRRNDALIPESPMMKSPSVAGWFGGIERVPA